MIDTFILEIILEISRRYTVIEVEHYIQGGKKIRIRGKVNFQVEEY